MPATRYSGRFAGILGRKAYRETRQTWRATHGEAVKRAYVDEHKSVPQIREEIFKRSVCEPTIYKLLRSMGVEIRTAPFYPVTEKQRVARGRNIAKFNAAQ